MKHQKESKLEDQTDRFQLTMDPDTEPHQWADQGSQRKVKRPEMLTIETRDKDGPLTEVLDMGKFNYLPPGMDRSNQYPDPTERQYDLKNSWDTGTEGPLTSRELNDKGYKRLQMSQTEEDADKNPEFFGEARGENDGGDKITGFLERRNILDRN